MLRPIRARRGIACCTITLFMVGSCAPLSPAQENPARKVINRVVPTYPELARKMGIKGIVRIQVTVEANGSVKNVDAKGGHPVLVQAAQRAIEKWKWKPAAGATTELIELRFEPPRVAVVSTSVLKYGADSHFHRGQLVLVRFTTPILVGIVPGELLEQINARRWQGFEWNDLLCKVLVKVIKWLGAQFRGSYRLHLSTK